MLGIHVDRCNGGWGWLVAGVVVCDAHWEVFRVRRVRGVYEARRWSKGVYRPHSRRSAVDAVFQSTWRYLTLNVES